MVWDSWYSVNVLDESMFISEQNIQDRCNSGEFMLYLYEVGIMYNIQKFLLHFYVVAFRVQTFCFPVNV